MKGTGASSLKKETATMKLEHILTRWQMYHV